MTDERITITRDRLSSDLLSRRYWVTATYGAHSYSDWTITYRGAARRGRQMLKRLREQPWNWEVLP